jgi:protein-S-isoprenylcysteine O-methyltransferase Ste14
MIKLGNYLYHHRNYLFPVFYALLFVKSPIIFEDYRIPLVIGFIIALSGEAIRVMTVGLKYIVRGGKNRKVYAEDLVTDGLFSHCRNPLYVGNVMIIVGLGVMSNSLYFNLIMSPLFIFIYQAIIQAEEDFLRNKFGDSFDQYCQKTNRWLPRLEGLRDTLSSMEFNWRRVIVKEYTSTFIWLFGATMLCIVSIYRNETSVNYNAALPFWIGVLGLWLSAYLVIKYLKTTKKLNAEY